MLWPIFEATALEQQLGWCVEANSTTTWFSLCLHFIRLPDSSATTTRNKIQTKNLPVKLKCQTLSNKTQLSHIICCNKHYPYCIHLPDLITVCAHSHWKQKPDVSGFCPNKRKMKKEITSTELGWQQKSKSLITQNPEQQKPFLSAWHQFYFRYLGSL